jgi:hypothetical protein
MGVEYVTTPDGRMRVSGYSRIGVGFVTDLVVATLLLTILAGIVARFLLQLPEVVKAAVVGAPWIYAFLAHRSLVPGMGSWALALRRYPYREIEEYSGSGVLFVYEDLPRRVFSRRAVVAAAVLAGLYLVAYLLLGPVAA